MSGGKSIPVWYSAEDRRRVEEAAALAGYRHLSKYIRDKTLDRRSDHPPIRDSMDAWDRQEMAARLAEIERGQARTHALLAMMFFLLRKKATHGDINELILACENSSVLATDVLDASSPEIAKLLTHFLDNLD